MYLDGYMLGGGLNNPLAPGFFFSPDALVQLPILMNENRIVQLAQKPLKKNPVCLQIRIYFGGLIDTDSPSTGAPATTKVERHSPATEFSQARSTRLDPSVEKRKREKRCDAQVLEENGPFTAIRMFVHSARFGLRWLDKITDKIAFSHNKSKRIHGCKMITTLLT